MNEILLSQVPIAELVIGTRVKSLHTGNVGTIIGIEEWSIRCMEHDEYHIREKKLVNHPLGRASIPAFPEMHMSEFSNICIEIKWDSHDNHSIHPYCDYNGVVVYG